MKTKTTLATVLAASFGLLSTSYGAAVTAPYSETFSNTTVANFIPGTAGSSTGATQAWSGTGSRYENKIVAGSGLTGYSSSTLQTTNVGGPAASALDFRMSTDVTLASVTQVNNTMSTYGGFGALGSTSVMGRYGGGFYYWAAIQLAKGGTSAPVSGGLMQIFDYTTSTSSGTLLGSITFPGTIAVGSTYHMELTGTYNTGQLTLSFMFDDPNDAAAATVLTVTPADNVRLATPATGRYFGLRDQAANTAISGTETGATIAYDNFSIVVPEPTTAALAGLVGIGALARRRRA